ncbi:hypothetical protein ACFTWS_33865 [Streptomyces sp. NPDC057027]
MKQVASMFLTALLGRVRQPRHGNRRSRPSGEAPLGFEDSLPAC